MSAISLLRLLLVYVLFLGGRSLAGADSFDEVTEDDFFGFDCVVVHGDDMVDVGRVNIGIGDSVNGDVEGVGLFDCVFVLDGVGND